MARRPCGAPGQAPRLQQKELDAFGEDNLGSGHGIVAAQMAHRPGSDAFAQDFLLKETKNAIITLR